MRSPPDSAPATPEGPESAIYPGSAGAGGARLWRRLVDVLPSGRTLPEDVWLRRHRALLALLWLHAAGLVLFAALRGNGLVHVLGHGAALVALAGLASMLRHNRRAAAACVSIGLITSSALLVHTWNGAIEGHFHFFVMIALLALYEDWLPFLLAAAYVVIHHGLTGAIDPGAVYNHPDAIRHPWKWAAIHGAFVVAAGTASVVTWRLNENVRAETQAAYRRARESEQRFKSAFEDAPIGMVLSTIEAERAGRFLQVNRAMCELTGYREEQLVGKRFTDITHPDDAEVSVAPKQKALAGEISSYQITKRYLHADGHAIWAEVHMSLVRDGSGQPAYTIAQVEDITERRLAEESIKESRRQLAEAQKLAQLGSWECRVESEEVVWSEELYRIHGLDPEHAIGTLEDSLARVHPDERRHVAGVIERSVATGEPFHEDIRIVRPDGTVRIVEAHGQVVVDAAENPIKMLGTAQDVTERRRVEGELALKQQAEKEHRARSEFLSRISHELRTPLNAILGFAQLLEMDALDATQRDNVDLIMKGGNHLLQLINEVLEISRVEAGTMTVSLEPVHVADSVAEAVSLLEPLAAEHHVTLENQLPDGADHYVRADTQRLKQVLLNLLSNAIKYNRDGGVVRVSLEAQSQDCVAILVTDTGEGISDENQARLFTPFDRLGADQSAIEGTGLGLALSKLLAEAMGGTLTVESEPRIGSTFTVGLFRAEAPAEDPVAAQGDPVTRHPSGDAATETILYVEDNLSNLRLVERILVKRRNIKLMSAMDGAMGLELARQHRPALVLLDLHLPGMDGEEVLRRLKDDPVTAQIPVVVVSADATRSSVERLVRGGATAFLTKPLQVSRFLSLVDGMLEEKAAA